MASQPIFAPYTPLPSAAPRPNIRIAYIAGDASIAIHRGMATFPPTVRESTLEELAIAGLTDELIAAGRELLSPAMFAAFLHWGQTASHFCSHYDTDEEGELRADAHLEASNAVASLPAKNVHDLLFKVRLLNTEAGDCPDFGPVDGHAADGWKLPKLIEGVGQDMPVMSPLIGLIDQLCTIAWDYSPNSHLAIDVAIGAIITGAFRAAREALESDPLAPAPVPAILDGYSPYMRGPLVAWRKAYSEYERARDELNEFERTRYRPTAAAYLKVRGNHSEKVTPEMQLALDAIPMDAAQEHFDELVDIRHEAVQALLLLPAPSAVELAIKLRIFHEDHGWELNYASKAIERIASDARRFGRQGAFLQSDHDLLTAFKGLKANAIAWFEHGAYGDVRDDALDAQVAALESVLWGNRAYTLEGIVARLRVLFQHISGEAWSDRALTDPKHPDFVRGVKHADGNHRALWDTIEDLARIGGVNVTEQGA